ncbi:BA3454 family stress response protein [Neobacillus sp. Marseille-QA0830]
MIEVMITVKLKDRNYNTNVIVHKGISEQDIQRLAEEQVMKQWGI